MDTDRAAGSVVTRSATAATSGSIGRRLDVGPEVPPVGGQVLGDQHDLLDPQRLHLGQDVRRATATAGGPGTTGWHRTRTCGRSPRPP